jgi:predicted acyltransferase
MTARATRDGALDALRGLAVLGMVLSGSLGFGGALPAWMFHAQLPPPLHRLVPTLPGITWVDLVFPMFLFALGAALPLALRDASPVAVCRVALRRGALLLYFAFFLQHAKPTPGAGDAGAAFALATFALLGLQLVRGVHLWLKAAAWLAAAALWAALGFDTRRSDIILVVLAVMAATGSLLWAATRGREAWRWWAMAAAVAVMLAPAEAWTRALTWTPADWAYRFTFLKYWLIVVPGMTVGEWLARGDAPCRCRRLAALALAIVVVNVTLLYLRETALNAALTALLLAWGGLRARREGGFAAQAWPLAVALVLLGLLMEPLQGGIRKDPSTFSYQVLTAGLSLLLLIALQGLAGRWQSVPAGLGRNPMLAYVAGSLCVLPLLQLSGLLPAWSGLTATAPQALMKGLVLATAVAVLTLAANRLGWVWRA